MPADLTPRSGMTRRHSTWTVAAGVCVLLAVIHTWPLATSPGRLSVNDNSDAQLNEWILAWVAHTLPRAPAHLFEANIFFPAHDTLAYSEPLIVPALLGAPLAWSGGSPVLVYNVMMIAGFALTALAAFALIHAWTGDRTASLLAASAFAFNTHTLTRLAHVQGLHLYGLPLALLAADRIVAGGGRRHAWLLALCMIGMAYTSGYLLVFGTLIVAIVVAVRMREWLPHARRTLGSFALATIVAALAILPLIVPYQRVAREQHMVRQLESVADFSATPAGYLAASGRLHLALWSKRFFTNPVDSFFPGLIVIALASVALWRAARPRGEIEEARLMRARVSMLGVIGLAGMVLSLGTATPIYGWLFHVFPPMQGLRAAARFGNLFLLAMAALAGIGLAALRARQPRARWMAAASIALIVAANVEALRAPFTYQRFTGIPPTYGLLAGEPAVVLAEVPFYPRQAAFENAEYVLNSTAHWRPLMNGYSGYTPQSYSAYADAFWYFPDQGAIDAMHRAGVTHVMVHPLRFGADGESVVAAIGRRPDFELMAVGPKGIRLYRLR